jgi:hypothetical protein
VQIDLLVLNCLPEPLDEDVFSPAALAVQADLDVVIFGSGRRLIRVLVKAAALLTLVPLSYIVNLGSSKRESAQYAADWVVMFAQFTVVKRGGVN